MAVLLMVGMCAGAFTCPLSAQQNVGSEQGVGDSLTAETAQVFQSIETGRQEIAELRSEMESASGEDREALENRVMEKGLELFNNARSLAGIVLERQGEGADVTGERHRVISLLQELSPVIQLRAEELTATMGDLREQREEAAPEKQTEIDDQLVVANSRLEELLQVMLEQIEMVEAFGLQSHTERGFLTTALEERAELLAGRIEVVQKQIEALDRDASKQTRKTQNWEPNFS